MRAAAILMRRHDPIPLSDLHRSCGPAPRWQGLVRSVGGIIASSLFHTDPMRRDTVFLLLSLLVPASANAQRAARARDLGIVPGTLPPGPLNAITDVAGVRVGQTTVRLGDSVRTGVTAILPHAGNIFLDRVPAAIYVGNGFGKLLGVTQVAELGELETPILLTCTLCVWKAADAMVGLAAGAARHGARCGRSIRWSARPTTATCSTPSGAGPITERDVRAALDGARERRRSRKGAWARGPERWRSAGRAGSAPRRAASPASRQHLDRRRARAVELRRRPARPRRAGRARARPRRRAARAADTQGAKGSIMMVVATDAPLSDRNLRRLAARALVGLGRTGSAMGNGSGDYVIAFSTHPGVRRPLRRCAARDDRARERRDDRSLPGRRRGDRGGDLQLAVHGDDRDARRGGTVEAMPVAEVVRILEGRGALKR